jgi:ATP-dependent exoDNAse (exonuclease V) beta subunit
MAARLVDTPAYAFPEALRAIPRDASAVVEASAGTGKTYLLEHLVIDRVLRGDARLEEILVVTFTEKATAELVRRLRALIERLLAHEAPARASRQTRAGSSTARRGPACWTRSAPSTARRSRPSTASASAS